MNRCRVEQFLATLASLLSCITKVKSKFASVSINAMSADDAKQGEPKAESKTEKKMEKKAVKK